MAVHWRLHHWFTPHNVAVHWQLHHWFIPHSVAVHWQLHHWFIPHSVAILAVNTEGLRSDNVTADIATPPVGPPQVPDQPTIGVITNQSAEIIWVETGELLYTWLLILYGMEGLGALAHLKHTL